MIKPIFAFIFLLISAHELMAQNMDMLSGNPQWTYSQYFNGVLSDIEPYALIDDINNGLTEINGNKYHLLFQVEQLVTDNGEVLFHPIEPLRVREKDGKVFVLLEDFQNQVNRLRKNELDVVPLHYLQTSETELLLYDFTLRAGDRYPTSAACEDIYVYKVEFIVTNDGNSRKLLILSNGLQILEGIGCLNSRNGTLLYYLYPPEAWKYNDQSYDKRLYSYIKNEKSIYSEFPLSSTMVQTRFNNNSTPFFYFDLQGRRLAAPPKKGVYIENGRKKIK